MSLKASKSPESRLAGGAGSWWQRFVAEPWRRATRWERARFVVLAVAVVGTISLQMVFADWFIEDAAISFAYARNLASGEGLVAYPGGERVEGYSNPLWVFLLAAWQVLGVNGFVSSKILGAVLGGATVWLTWAITRDLREEEDAVPLFAALLLAANPQFVIWNAGGLENSLFCFLLALGTWRALAEARDGGWPWSALVFFALAITRPEGILYAAAAGFWAMVFALAGGRGVVPTLQWLFTFFLPMGLYQAARYLYFAWPLPNTYYSKLDRDPYSPMRWSYKGWRYLQGYAHELWQGYLLPVYLVGMTGLRGRRAWLGLLPLLAVAAALLYPGPKILTDLALWPDFHPPPGWDPVRIWILVGVAVVTPLLVIGRPGWRGRVLCWSLAGAGLYFTVRAGGDWMRGFRWLSLVSVPMAVLFAAGVGDVGDGLARIALRRAAVTGRDARRAPGRWFHRDWGLVAGLVALVLFLLPFPPAINHLVWYRGKPETTPAKILDRVRYMRWVEHRLHLDHVVDLDVDMGGTMYWSGHEIVDIAGLVDVPMGHHDYEKPFIREYMFEERKPDFAHLHGGWERKMGVKSLPEYKRDYLEIPGYPTGKTSLHLGNRIRRDLFVASEWPGSPDRVVFYPEDIVVEGFEVPLGEGTPGRHFYMELALRGGRRFNKDDFRVIAFVSDGESLHCWSIPPGYDWYFPHEWAPEEVVFTKNDLPLPADLPLGTYDLGLVILNGQGAVLSPEVVPSGVVVGGRDGVEPRFAVGEVRWPAVLTVVSRKAEEAGLALDMATLEDDAETLRCEEAEQGWERLRWRRPHDYPWQKRVRPAVARALSGCWLGRAGADVERAEVVEHLARARWWDHNTPGLRRAARPVANALYAEGMEARARGDWEAAYRLFSDVLRVDATRSFARRYAEEARDHRLGLAPGAEGKEQ